MMKAEDYETFRSIQVVRCTMDDWDAVWTLYNEVIQAGQQAGRMVWQQMDRSALEQDLHEGRLLKLVQSGTLIGACCYQLEDPLIWGAYEDGRGLYLHRMARRQPAHDSVPVFPVILSWAGRYAASMGREAIRLDTWSANTGLIAYYRAHGFAVVGTRHTGDDARLPLQNRNLQVTLLEKTLDNPINLSSL